jgi:hypothetical protein
MFQFELHPHIGEICTDILVYEKGGVVNVSKHQQESKLSFLICEKMKCVMMWNRVKYFFENWNDRCICCTLRS